MSTLIDIITKQFKGNEDDNASNNENTEVSVEHPEIVVEKLRDYHPTEDYTNELKKISSVFGVCDDAFMKKFIDLFGVIKLMHVLDLVQRSGPTQIDQKIKSEHYLIILTILHKIIENKCGLEYLQKNYEMEPEESNLLRTFVSYLSLQNEDANEILMDLINSLNETRDFAQHCYHQLKEPRPDVNNGLELLCQLLNTDNSQNVTLNNSICVLIKQIVSKLPTDSPLYEDFVINLHDIAFIDKMGIIGENYKKEDKDVKYVNFVLELYEDLSIRYSKIKIE
ncbi:hypothetical protein M9Y10_040408 [Tritrichomonas musculus]|uniref:SPIN90/Ldb17 leucine-rich domain-containing protein n=1 Tax=Tritrichomonas musculus TaxID=1915356 RepID=A0ABR2GPI6_9EUKA